MRLSENFWLAEASRSSTAVRLGIDNTVPADLIPKIQLVAQNILQPVRDHFGIPIIFNGGLSWYRSLELNRALKSDDDSQHPKAEAVDLEIFKVSNLELALWISQNLSFDQLILEHWDPEDPAAGWVHCSYVSHETNRGEILRIGKAGTFTGLGVAA